MCPDFCSRNAGSNDCVSEIAPKKFVWNSVLMASSLFRLLISPGFPQLEWKD